MALKTVDVTFQNLDSSEISLTDVSHYYDSDPTKVVSSLRDDKKKPSSFMADTTTANAQASKQFFRRVYFNLDDVLEEPASGSRGGVWLSWRVSSL